MISEDIRKLLDEKYRLYNRTDFIENDPVCIPHMFDDKENIEIAGFFSALLSWGQRKVIIRNAERLMNYMGNEPYNFIMDVSKSEVNKLQTFVHRTFQFTDLQYFIMALRHLYKNYGGLHRIFAESYSEFADIKFCLQRLHDLFFELPHPVRTRKHISNIGKGASAKRLNMFLRWMVRNDPAGVDFGLWNDIPASALYIPLDVHTARISRGLNLLKRKQDDWKAVEELTTTLRLFDPADPVKYDYALFGMGIFEQGE